ncbi:class I SAM-dependent methyltransferase [Planococcus sp. MB-3u-03]|uniref:class I SAM-dependent methyltransferase n=1 Tax=Planococcus sp. MB-3u-03 TaxID=2058136 RepID=UPI001E3CE000|nr:methyltransferase domain-containing protein [Planococcus sp. MB-3u-03]
MNFDDNQFDFVIASLILSVVPDPNTCLREMARVLKNSGELIIFDKFSSTETSSSIQRRLVRPFVKLLGTDIALSFKALFEENKRYLKLIDKSPVMFNGFILKFASEKNKKL